MNRRICTVSVICVYGTLTNINQISVRANSTGNVYAADLDEIEARQAEIWRQQDEIMKKLNKIIGEVS